jgi:tRNA nucleotidyltransferase (CCA-adding enzyme)
MANFNIPEEVEHVTTALSDAGFDSYLVGGCVRDLIRGIEPKDWDITTNATPEKIQGLFEDSFYENDYGTVGVKTDSEDARLKVIEVTPYRIEGKYTDARRPDSVIFAKTLEEDLERRDFTINAIAYDPQKKEVVDPHGGQKDIEKKTITAVGIPHDRFSEDALRMMRAIRLSAELDFTIESETANGIANNAALLEKISQERIKDEFIRILMSDTPMQALFVAEKLGLLSYIIPELQECMGIKQNQAHSYDVFEHLLRTLQHSADKKWPLEVRIAALLHDIGKPSSRRWSDEKNDYTFHGHEVIGARIAKKILKRLRFSREIMDKVWGLVRWHMFFSDPDKITLSAVRRVIRNVGQENMWDLLNLRICDRIGTGRPKEQPFRLRKYISMVEEALRDPVSVGQLAIDGSDIMKISGEMPGPRLGWVLHALLEEVLDDPKLNEKKILGKRTLELLALAPEELKKLGEKGKTRMGDEDDAEIVKLRKKYHVN